MNKDKLKLEKHSDKKFLEVEERLRKFEDFFTKKLEFMKTDIELELSSKTTAIFEE